MFHTLLVAYPATLLVSTGPMEAVCIALTLAVAIAPTLVPKSDTPLRSIQGGVDHGRTLMLCLLVFIGGTVFGTLANAAGASQGLDLLSDSRWMLYLLVLTMALSSFLDSAWPRVAVVLAASLTLVGAIAVMQFFSGWPVPPDNVGRYDLDPYGSYFRAAGLFNYATTLAGSAGMVTCLLFGSWAVVSRHAPARWNTHTLVLIACVVGTAAVLGTLTRWAAVAIAISLIAGSTLVSFRWGIRAVIVTVAVLCVAYFSDANLQERILSATSADDTSRNERMMIWQANWAMVKAHPFVGLGYENNIDRLAAFLPNHPDSAGIGPTHAHNNFLHIWSGQGLFALLAFVGASLVLARSALNTFRDPDSSDQIRGLGLGCLLAQLYFHLIGLSDTPFINLKINHCLIFIWALTLAAEIRRTRSA